MKRTMAMTHINYLNANTSIEVCNHLQLWEITLIAHLQLMQPIMQI